MARTRVARRALAGPAPVAFWRRRRAVALLIAALAFVTYLNALDNPFVYDDFFTVTGNPSIAAEADPHWAVIYMPFRPVVNISYALDRRVWGYRPFGYHLTSVTLHAAVAVLLFVLLLRALRDGREASGAVDVARRRRESWAAFAGAALFAVHPIQSETAGYVSSRSEILCGLFLLSTLLLARAAKAQGSSVTSARARVVAGLGAAVCALLALLSKEVAASLPVLLLGYDWLLLHSASPSARRRALMVVVPLGLVTAVTMVYRVRSLAGTDATVAAAPLLNLLTQSIVIWRYLGLMLWPSGQSIMHSAHTVTTLADPLGLAAAAGLVALAGVAFILRRRLPLLTMGTLWWFACIAPSSSVIALRETMAEHRVYVASAGIAMIVTALVERLLECGGTAVERVPMWFKVGLPVVLASCVVLTIERNRVWQSPVAVWREAIAATPGAWEPHYALADALRENGACAPALSEYETVLAMKPATREVLTNYGICLGQLERLPEAAAAFRQALVIDPQYARGYTNLAAVSLLEGHADQARDYYQRAISVDPKNVHARMQLARIYEERLQDYARAAQLCAEARAISPSTPGATDCIVRNEQRGRGGAS